MTISKGFLIDFDGVIAPTAIKEMFDFLYGFINERTPIPRKTFDNYFKVVSSFQVKDTVSLLFTSLGIEEHLSKCFETFNNYFKDYHKSNIPIDPYLPELLGLLKTKGLEYKIFSTAKEERFKSVDDIQKKDLYLVNKSAKADPRTFIELAAKLNINLTDYAIVDDVPLVLRSAKLNGMMTIMCLNEVYTIDDYYEYEKYIDYKIQNLRELIELLGK